MDRNPYSPPASATEVAPAIESGSGPVGLSGWLVVVCLGLILTPLRLGIYLVQTYPPIFRDGTWQTLTTPGPAPYHPFWGPLLVLEMVSDCLFIAATVYLLFLFFMKSWRFPKIYIGYLVANVAFLVMDALAVHVVLPGRPLFDATSGGDLGRSVIGAAIWIPYMSMSRRVRNTFVQIS
ncbi:MAG TPA: DUF2569 domain-containing protein [Steroidobacteraceae bacterium]|nr:DUF2569 domain-containing protein [Steroidobacteraceae bacterium]